MMKVIVVDDDFASVQAIERVLVDHFNISLHGHANDLKSGAKLIEESQPDLVFLDIRLPDGKGFELVNPQAPFKVIFITAFDDYAIKAFDLAAIDYLLKPLNTERVVTAFRRFMHTRNSTVWNQKFEVFTNNRNHPEQGTRIVLKSTEGFEFVKVANIVMCESDGNYCKIFLENGKAILSSKTLRSMQDLLSQSDFFRCHQSFLINTQYIVSFKSHTSEIELSGSLKASLARSKKREFLELISRFE